ncbi:MAG: hypothetical protein ACHQRM_07485 [Bacteroidia bacterium]
MKIFFLTCLGFVLHFSNSLLACKCGEHKPLSMDECRIYDVIFTGKVDSVSSCHNKYATVYFHLEDLYKGKSLAQVGVRYDCESDCQLSLAKGEQWLVYAQYYQYNGLEMEFCSRSRKYISKGDDYYTALNLLTWKDECDRLEHLLGKHDVMKKEEPAMKERVLVQPNAYGKIILLGISLAVLILIFYFVKKLP